MADFPAWVDVIAIDPNGEMWGFEGDCYFESGQWIPVDDGDGLECELLGRCDTFTILDEDMARKLYFRKPFEPDPEDMPHYDTPGGY